MILEQNLRNKNCVNYTFPLNNKKPKEQNSVAEDCVILFHSGEAISVETVEKVNHPINVEVQQKSREAIVVRTDEYTSPPIRVGLHKQANQSSTQQVGSSLKDTTPNLIDSLCRRSKA